MNKETIVKNIDKTVQKIDPIIDDIEDREYKILTFKDSVILDIPLDNIYLKPQVRKLINEDKIEELASSILQNGLYQPITVMMHPKEKDRYILKIGENRYRAHKLINRQQIRAVVTNYSDDDTQIRLDQLNENIHRIDLHPIDTSEAVISLKQDLGLTLEKTANLLNRSLSLVKKLSQINNLSTEKKNFIKEQQFSFKDIMKLIDTNDDSEIDSSDINEKKNNPKQPYQTQDGIKNYKNAFTLRVKIHHKDQREEIRRKIQVCQEFIDRATKHLEEPGHR